MDNAFIPQFEQKFLTMTAFSVNKSLGQKVDIFSYSPVAGQSMAAGYRVQKNNNRCIAEPWVFVVPNKDKSTGVEIGTRPDNAMYFGVVVPDALIEEYGTLAYSLMLGNLSLLKQNAQRLVSY